MPTSDLHAVFRTVVIAKLCYAIVYSGITNQLGALGHIKPGDPASLLLKMKITSVSERIRKVPARGRAQTALKTGLENIMIFLYVPEFRIICSITTDVTNDEVLNDL